MQKACEYTKSKIITLNKLITDYFHFILLIFHLFEPLHKLNEQGTFVRLLIILLANVYNFSKIPHVVHIIFFIFAQILN